MLCSPSFLSCDFTKIETEILSVNQAKWLHFDVMDGVFVTNTTYTHHMLQKIKHISNQFFDCHLMIVHPEEAVDDYIKAGADLVTFHYEATDDPKSLIRYIQSKGVKAGISIKPDTDVSVLDGLLDMVDLVLIMSVEPGKGGQRFLPSAVDKIAYLHQERIKHNYHYRIEVDGGINLETAAYVKDAGCDVIVVGSFIFNQKDRNAVIEALENV